jgi:hypothetical protein
MAKLTVKLIQAIKDAGRYGDGDGLYLEVGRTGSKSWILRTTVQGRRRDIGLGGISWVSLAEARDKARKLRKIAKDGGDPLAERRVKEGMLTFEEAARKVYANLVPGWRNGGVHTKHWIGSLVRSKNAACTQAAIRYSPTNIEIDATRARLMKKFGRN